MNFMIRKSEYFSITTVKRRTNCIIILGSLNSPLSGIVGSINAAMRDLFSVIEEVAKKKAA